MFKIHALWEAAQRNDFQTTHFAWLDLGCFHVLAKDTTREEVEAVLADPKDRVTVC